MVMTGRFSLCSVYIDLLSEYNYLPGYLRGVATPGRDVESQSDEAMRLRGTSP